MILIAEINGSGCKFENLFEWQANLKFSFGELLIFMNIASILQLLLTVYIEHVFPGEFGIAKPWHFPISSLLDNFKPVSSEVPQTNQPLTRSADCEQEPTGLRTGIKIKNLSKSFKNKFAVKNLSLNLYESQITVLLGHNGAGKTTTMSMLTGLFQPTSGTAYVNGCDIKMDLKGARQSLGVCQQHDVLFEDMTVEEHLMFYSKLKGMTGEDEIMDEVEKYAGLLGISEKMHEMSRNLSGGQKRRLSIGIALCGHPKVVILDECTSGEVEMFPLEVILMNFFFQEWIRRRAETCGTC